ncbi:MAG: hypothetical protein Q8P22_11315 [Chloroflexota bacterium]|nr:hypothetical protein [Chloroflexota bacterium]
MERPNDGRVANNGSFVLNDWLFGEGLKGVFCAIGKDGTVLIRHRFEANLLNAGISPGGAFAVCQTCNTDNDDGGQLCCFDLASGSLLWKAEPETGWAEEYSFDVGGRSLNLHYSKLGAFRYSLRTGSFEDRERWLDHRIVYGNGFDLLTIAQERMRQLTDVPPEEQIRAILELLQTALTRGLNDYPN